MSSAERLVTMMGSFNIMGNIQWAECMGPSIAVGRASEEDSGPIRHNRQRFKQTHLGPFNAIRSILQARCMNLSIAVGRAS
jgi:hypothetical protein